MQDVIMEAVIGALGTILIAIIGYATQKAVKWLEEKGVTEQLHKKKYLVDIGVHAAEQLYKNENGAEKLQKAKGDIRTMLNANGLSITEKELDDFIEASVQEMKANLQVTNQTVVNQPTIPE